MISLSIISRTRLHERCGMYKDIVTRNSSCYFTGMHITVADVINPAAAVACCWRISYTDGFLRKSRKKTEFFHEGREAEKRSFSVGPSEKRGFIETFPK